MINSLNVTGYKCLENISIEMQCLNVFAGPNSAGKSSFLQTLLLLRQSARSNGQIDTLKLSGELYEAGTSEDVLHPAADHKIKISLKFDNEAIEYNFFRNRKDESLSQKRSLQIESVKELHAPLFSAREYFAYLNAERLGPRLTYPLPPEDTDTSGIVGKYGEYTAALLSKAKMGIKVDGWNTELAETFAQCPQNFDGLELLDDLINTDGRLDSVCDLFFGWIIPGAGFSSALNDETDFASVRFSRPVLTAKTFTRSTHSGFGLTYTLPIIVAALAIKSNGMMIVENPEAHLPPFSQSRIGAFLAMMAATGRQIFVETHSDHVINGMRLAVKLNQIPPEKILFNFFNKKNSEDSSKVISIKALENGRLEKWPEGFFDQIENDLSRL